MSIHEFHSKLQSAQPNDDDRRMKALRELADKRDAEALRPDRAGIYLRGWSPWTA